jgi:hypothetical protein
MADKKLELPLLHDLQATIIKDKTRFRVVSCGRRWGKTYMAMVGLYCMMAERFEVSHKKQRGWIVAPTFPLVREDWLSAEIILDGFITNKKQTEMRMDFDKIGFIEFKSADREDEGLRGAGLDCAVIDEASRVTRKSWEQGLRPALSDKQGRCIFISTPLGRNWFYELWLQGQVANDQIKSWKHPTSSNPYFPVEEWKTIYESTPEIILKQEYLADFMEDSASVFKNIESCYRGVLEGNKMGEHYTIGVDLGKSHDFTVITVINDKTCQVVHIDRFNQIDWSLQKKKIKAVCMAYPNNIVYIDSTGLGDPIEEDLRQNGVATKDYKFTNESKQELVEGLIVAIEQGLLGIPKVEQTKFLIDELKAFTYERLPSGRLRYTAPEGLHDDGVISLGLACRGMSWNFYRKMQNDVLIPYNSPAYLERKSLEKDLEINSHLPRRLRRRISQELAFS